MDNKTRAACLGALLLGSALALDSARADPAPRLPEALWAHGRLYVLEAGPPAPGPRGPGLGDTVYDFSESGLRGQRAVSEAAPGDPGYTGGRWALRAVAFTARGLAAHDADGDGEVDSELTSAEAVLVQHALGHLEVGEVRVLLAGALRPWE